MWRGRGRRRPIEGLDLFFTLSDDKEDGYGSDAEPYPFFIPCLRLLCRGGLCVSLYSEYFLDGLNQVFFRHQATAHLRHAFHGAEEQCRYAAYAEEPGEFGFALGVNLVDVDFALIFGGKLFEDWGKTLAGATPSGVEVDDTGLVSTVYPLVRPFLVVHHFLDEVLAGHVDCLVCLCAGSADADEAEEN